jgi:hypothetical protein
MKKLIFSLILIAVSFLSYGQEQEYVPGDLLVGFREAVDGQQVLAILKRFGLTPVEPTTSSRLTYWFKTKPGTSQTLIKTLSQSNLFSDVSSTLTDDGSDESTDTVLAYAKLSTTQDDVKKFLTTLTDVEIKSFSVNTISVQVKVTPGEEEAYIRKLSTDKNIATVGRNALGEFLNNAD